MSVDSRLRADGTRLREQVMTSLDADAALQDLLARRRHRTRRTAAVAAGAVAASLALVVALVNTDLPGTGDAVVAPVDRPVPSSVAPSPIEPSGCADYDSIRCLGGGMVRVSGATTYRLTVPPGFVPTPAVGNMPDLVDVYQENAHAGVTVLPDVRRAGKAGPGEGARSLAEWIAARSSVDAGAVRRDRLGDLTAWTVQLRSRDGRTVPVEASCNQTTPRCRPLLRQSTGWETGIWDTMTSRYWLVDLPGGDVLAVWSWQFDGSDAMRLNENLARSLKVESSR